MPEEKRPNVIWVFADQLRGQALGYMGDPNAHTPHLDRLAAEGVAFTQAVAGTPLCCPFRGSLLTSRYPHQCVPGHQFQMPPEQPTIAHAMRDAGYRTSYIGKWHLDGFEERNGRAAMHIVPPERRGGFDHWIGYENNNSQWDCWVHGGEGSEAYHYQLPGYETDELTNLLLADIDACSDTQPFFSVLSVQPPHDPYVAPAEYMRHYTPGSVELRANVPAIERYERTARRELAGYYAMLENLDDNVGRIREKLVEKGIAADTHIIFFSDHGDMLGSHGQFRKTSPWEESIRIPFIIGGGRPFYGSKGGYQPVPLNHVDIVPTTLGLCGIAVPGWVQGTDYSGLRLRGKEAPSQPGSAYLQLVEPTRHPYSIDRPWRGLVTRDGWKYVVLENQPLMMHNLNEDPYEQVNLAFNTMFQSKRRELQDRLAQWIADTDDEFALPEIQGFGI